MAKDKSKFKEGSMGFEFGRRFTDVNMHIFSTEEENINALALLEEHGVELVAKSILEERAKRGNLVRLPTSSDHLHILPHFNLPVSKMHRLMRENGIDGGINTVCQIYGWRDGNTPKENKFKADVEAFSVDGTMPEPVKKLVDGHLVPIEDSDAYDSSQSDPSF